MASKSELKNIAVSLFDIGSVKYGRFITKVGLETPIYIDLREIISEPKLMRTISKQLWSLHNSSNKSVRLCGVPYTALPMATVISDQNDIPMIMRRKEAKAYGTKKLIEGKYKSNDEVIIIEDIITSGSSVLETVNDCKKEGLNVTTALVVVDREQGGRKNLEDAGINVKCLFTITELMVYLHEAGRVTEESVKVVRDYVKAVQAPVKKTDKKERLSLDFKTRAKSASNPMAARILNLMAEKETTICLAADFTKTQAILNIAELAGPYIATLKIHVDIIQDFNNNFIDSLKSLAKKHKFLIMEDRKFADIGHVVTDQFSAGVYRIADWADLITAHAIPGSGIIDGIKTGLSGDKDIGIFIVGEMSSKGALTTGEYTTSSVNMAKNQNLVAGFVCQNNVFDDLGLVQLTPGVKLMKSSDGLGQQYNTPDDVVANGADLVVVGRGITEASDKLQAVLEYKKVCYEAYKSRLQ